MKTRSLLLTIVFFLCSIILPAQTTTIPDAHFEQALIDLGIDSDGTINQGVADSDISGITTLNVSNKNINDLTGIEGFTSLIQLFCYNNQLTTLDVTQNTSLKILYCFSNQLTGLDVTQNTALRNLWCNNNQVTSLDVTPNTDLYWLNCSNNQLTSLDISQNTDLYVLDCNTNQLASLDVVQQTSLGFLSCYKNQLTNIDVTQNTSLSSLNCHTNQLTSIDVTQNTALTNLSCNNNLLTSLDVTQNTSLSYLYCNNNQLTSLDVTQNTALMGLDCGQNQLTGLGVTQNTALRTLYCYTNQLTTIDVTQNTALTHVICEQNQLTSLDVSNSPALIYLDCEQNQLTSLNVSNNPALTYLIGGKNQLTNLELSGNPALTHLNCQYNQLTSLDISYNPALAYFYCERNQLISLDVSDNPALKLLYCHTNQLTRLNVKNGNNINIQWFYASSNPNLTCIQVDDPVYSTANWPHKDATATYMETCNMPPVAACQNVNINADENCEANVTPDMVNNGSNDPDGDPITLSLHPAGPYPMGETTVTLTVADDGGETDQCTATVAVVDATKPVISAITNPIVAWPPNHQYETYIPTDFVLSVWDNCTSLSIDDINITKATSDEVEDAEGGQDGNTLDDIVIAADCKSVQLRKERQAGDNGRVYTIHLELDDGNGNTGAATCQVVVPPNINATAVDDGAVYEELGDCGNKSSFITSYNSESDIALFNYPNPFNGVTTITFTLAETDNTTLKVYDTFGKEVATLFDGIAESGQQYNLDFSSGNLSKGMYLFHLQSGSKVSIIKKMILSD